MDVDEQVLQVLESALNVRLDRTRVRSSTPLRGAIPEFDSMAAVAVLTGLEERFGFVVHDDDIDGSTFETLGSLAAFVQGKRGA